LCDGTDWEQVIDNGLGNSDSRLMPGFEVFDDRLYLAVGNLVDGMQVWQTNDGDNWYPIAMEGFYDSDNWSALWDYSLVEYEGHLYLGTWNPANGGEIWRRMSFGAVLDPTADAKQGHPGETVDYMIEVTNEGEETDTFDVSLDGHAWATTANPTIGPLDPGEMAVLTVSITVPPTAIMGDTDGVVVTVTSQGDGLEYSEAVLTTGVYVYQLYLPLIMR
ncbi:MAG: FixG Ig-like domain-containing protein, partial [Anaerolineales bacterium]